MDEQLHGRRCIRDRRRTLIGALPRLLRARRILPAAFVALGMVILMNSRPFDGALLSVAALAYLAAKMRPHRQLARMLAPAAVVLACGIIFTGYYNWRVTGSPLRMPYQVNRDTYGWPENLAFLPAKKLTLQDPVLQKMYLKEVAQRDAYNSPFKILDNLLTRLFDNWTYFIGPVLTAPLLFLAVDFSRPENAAACILHRRDRHFESLPTGSLPISSGPGSRSDVRDRRTRNAASVRAVGAPARCGRRVGLAALSDFDGRNETGMGGRDYGGGAPSYGTRQVDGVSDAAVYSRNRPDTGLGSTESSAARGAGGLGSDAGAHGVAAARAVPHPTGVPGVMLAGNSTSSGVLLASRQNIQIESGAQIELGVVADR